MVPSRAVLKGALGTCRHMTNSRNSWLPLPRVLPRRPVAKTCVWLSEKAYMKEQLKSLRNENGAICICRLWMVASTWMWKYSFWSMPDESKWLTTLTGLMVIICNMIFLQVWCRWKVWYSSRNVQVDCLKSVHRQNVTAESLKSTRDTGCLEERRQKAVCWVLLAFPCLALFLSQGLIYYLQTVLFEANDFVFCL